MEQTQSQPTNQLLNTQPAGMMPPDQAAASLAFATHLQGQLVQHMNPANPNPQEGQNVQGKEKPQEQKDSQKEIEALRTEFEKKIEDMKKGITEEIKSDIKDALQSDNANE